MARLVRRPADIGFAALSIEGGLIAPDQVRAIANVQPDQKTAAEYGCPKGTGLRDEITRYFRIAQAHWTTFARIQHPTSRQTAAFVRDLLEQAFGYALTGPHTYVRDDRRFAIAWEGRGGRVPIVVAPPPEPGASKGVGKAADGFARALPEFGDGEGGRIQRRSPMVLLQDWLNASPDTLWGLVFAGDRVRLLRDNASLTRPAWIEADLGAIFRDEMFADFTALWLLIHASRFGSEGAAPTDCALERWREAGQRTGTSARDRLRANVEEALTLLGQGLLEANAPLRQRLDSGALSLSDLFGQMLRLVYRLIFLAVAEDRDLLHPPATARAVRELYGSNYGFGWLRERSARRRAHDHHHDAWEAVKVVFRALERGEPQLGLPALGGLFDRLLTPDLDGARLPNRAFLGAAFKLAWLIEDGRRVRINWRDMATEELGSVYEGLLELVPVRTDEGRAFGFANAAESKGNARKTSGSYYTPDSLVQCLLDSALNPVLDRAEAEGGANGILDLRVIDPACGSGHFLLGAARRMATRVAQLRNPDAPDYNAAMRDVVRDCIHGVDRNPMAVELARVALWIESVEPGKPLGFLDANVQCGDSLLGIFDLAALDEGIPDDAYKPLTGDDKETARYYAKRNRAEREGQGTLDFVGGSGALPPARLATTMADLRHLPEDSLAQIAEKRRRRESWKADPRLFALERACDLYVAAFLLAKTGGVPAGADAARVPTTAHVRTLTQGGQVAGRLFADAVDVAREAGAFHWPLAFPDVMIGRGGFDVVLGNPPWEVVQLGEEEYFASRVPEIAALKGATRKRAIEALANTNPDVFTQFQADKRAFDAVNEFARSSGRFDLTARGKVNTYGLFAEHFLTMLNPQGAAGMIVPTGIATDATTAPFFGHLVSNQRLASLFDFENSAPLFQSVHRSFKFALLTYGSSVPAAAFAFFLTDPAQLDDERRRFTLSPSQIAAINPNTKTAPVFRARRDAELTAQIYARVPVLIEEAAGDVGNPWGIEFRQGLFNMTSDSGLFRTAEQLAQAGFRREGTHWVRDGAVAGAQRPPQGVLPLAGGRDGLHLDLSTGSAAGAQARYVPLYEAKMIHQFDHRWANGSDIEDGGKPLSRDGSSEPNPRYWIDTNDQLCAAQDARRGGGWLLASRMIARLTDERTFIASMIPDSGVGNSAAVWRQPTARHLDAAPLLANINALVTDWIVRQKVGGANMNFFYVQQFPILPPTAYTEADLAFIVPRVLELTYTSQSMAPFARDLGHDGPPFAWDEDRRARLRAELDAWYALAYGLGRDELRYILDPRDVMGPDYPSETFRVLQKNELARHGEYRTRRLVLEAYDQLVSAGQRPRVEGYR